MVICSVKRKSVLASYDFGVRSEHKHVHYCVFSEHKFIKMVRLIEMTFKIMFPPTSVGRNYTIS